jgi:hypothetical protein
VLKRTVLAFALLLFGVTSAFPQVAPGMQFYFPQLALGAAGSQVYETAYILMNPGTTTAQVKLEFFDDAGNPLIAEFGALVDEDAKFERKASVDLTVAPNATVGLSSDNSAPDGRSHLPLQTGWTKVTSNVPIWPLSAFLVHPAQNGATISAVGVPPVTPSQQWTVFAVKDSENSPVDIGIAAANPSDVAITLTATFFDPNGVQLAQSPISLAPRGHLAKFSGEMFPSVPVPFVGKIVVTSSTPFVMMSLFIDGAVMTSFPAFRP